MDSNNPNDTAIREGDPPFCGEDGRKSERRPDSGTDIAIQARPGPSPLRAAAIIALAWLPAIIVAASLPWFVPTFDRWHWELPPLTLFLMSVGRLGVGPIVLAGIGLVAVLASGGAGWVRAGLPGRRAVPFAFALAGIGVAALIMLCVLVPIVTAPVAR